jgi:hypothetical protein
VFLVFVPHQIVYLESHAARLYAEVIQTLEQRQMCWVRPLILSYAGEFDAPLSQQGNTLEILEDGPDLLWPTHQFKVAVDTEVLPLLGILHSKMAAHTNLSDTTSQALRQFIRQLWVDDPPIKTT